MSQSEVKLSGNKKNENERAVLNVLADEFLRLITHGLCINII